MTKAKYLTGALVGNQELDRILNDILTNDERQKPIVSEDVFINQIIPLLQRPWQDDNLLKYKRFVHELTMPLRVAGVRNGETVVLYTVPALHAPVDTSQASIHDITVGHLIDHATMLKHRGTNEPVDEYVAEYLHRISQLVPIEQKLLIPIAAILGLYGKTFLDDLGNPLYSLDGINENKGITDNSLESESFQSDGYLDED